MSDVAECDVPGCDRPRHRRKWCATHWREWLETGVDPIKVIRVQVRSEPLGEDRVCIQCLLRKPLKAFREVPRRRDGLDPTCKDCRHLNHRLARMSMTVEDFEDRLLEQDYQCAGCHEDLPREWSGIYVDHDHRCCPGNRSCGKCIRGLLHNWCNVILGHAKDNPQRLRDLAAYLEGHDHR